MNPDTGQIHKISAEDSDDMKKRLIPLTCEQEQTLRPMSPTERKGHMRNLPCECGSGKKFKKCCWDKYANDESVTTTKRRDPNGFYSGDVISDQDGREYKVIAIKRKVLMLNMIKRQDYTVGEIITIRGYDFEVSKQIRGLLYLSPLH